MGTRAWAVVVGWLVVSTVQLGCSEVPAPADDELFSAAGDGGLAGAGSGGGVAPPLAGDSGASQAQLTDGGLVATPGSDASEPAPAPDGAIEAVPDTEDPGTGPWALVPAAEVAAECQLDPDRLAEADSKLNAPWAIIRHGRLCHTGGATLPPEEAWSTTKTLGAVVAGMVAYQTRDLVSTGPKTGPFSDTDLASQWLSSVPYNAQAHVSHVMAMVAHNADLSLGKKAMVYDTVGTMQINTLSDMLNAAIAQDPERLGGDLEGFTQKFLFARLGMKGSSWNGGAPTKVVAYSWSTTVQDMARLGLLMLNHGVWNGERLLDEGWLYRMTHPSYEDANTGYGYLTWLNATSNHNFGGIPLAPTGMQQMAMSPGPCAPVALHATYPNPISGSPDCGYTAPASCEQPLDVGVWQAVGLGGQVIQGHPGLDLVIVVKNLTPGGTGPSAPALLWDAVRPAVIDGDPMFAGDEAGFCAAYGGNQYAPDLD